MDALKKILHEIPARDIEWYLRFNDKKSGQHAPRSRLINLLMNKEQVNDTLAACSIYNKKPDSNYFHFKTRLKEELLNLAMVSCTRSGKTSEKDEELFCLTLMAKCKFLLSRNLYHDAGQLLSQCLKITRKKSYPFLHLKVLHLLKDLYIQKGEFHKLNQLRQEMADCIEVIKDDLAVTNYGTQILQVEQDSPGQYSDSNISSETGEYPSSHLILNNNKASKLETMVTMTDRQRFNEAYDYGKKLAAIFDPEASCSPDCRVWYLNEMARLAVFLNQYSQAIEYANTALQVSGSCEWLQFYTKKLLFYAYLRIHKLDRAENILHTTIEALEKKQYTELLRVWQIMKPGVDFLNKKYTVLLNDLNRKRSKIPFPWACSVRFLEIMSLVEIGDLCWAEYKLEAFRKFITRFELAKDSRIHKNYQLFRKLEKNSFDFEKTVGEEKHTLNLLMDNKSCHRWNPIGPEIINIPDWLLQKT